MSDKVEIKVGATVQFAVGRAKTVYQAEVRAVNGAFLVTVDAAGAERRVRPGSCTIL